MNMKMAPADDASKQALGAAAGMLSNLAIKGSGTGAMQVVDPATHRANVKMDMTTDAMGQKFIIQTVTISDTSWVRIGSDGKWQKADANASATTAKSQTGMTPGSMFMAFDSATDVKWLDDNPLNGQPVHHLSFTIDPAKLKLDQIIQNSQNGKATPEELQAIMKNMTLSGEAWLGADDLLPRQEKVNMTWVMPLPGGTGTNANLKVGMDTTMVFDKINQPVDIQPPAN
jgi:hypothetical protein